MLFMLTTALPCFFVYKFTIPQIFGSIGSVGGGLALGKEGPLVHTGACIASLLGQVIELFSTFFIICSSVSTLMIIPISLPLNYLCHEG